MEIRGLIEQGVSIRAAAAALHISRKTVRRYLYGLPDNARRRRPGLCDPYEEYLLQRWEEGMHNGPTLLEEIRARGYRGSSTTLRQYLQPWRAALPHDVHPGPRSRRVGPKLEYQTVSAGQFRRLVLKNVRTSNEEELLARITAADSKLAISAALAHEFMTAMHTRDVTRFDAWLETAASTNIPEWRAFVDGLHRDLEAVHNGITLKWSQGPVEGSIHRLKLIKRAMYGRGRHDLLRLRVIFHLPD